MDYDLDSAVRRVATEFVRSRGADAFAYLNERAELAEAAGDLDSAIAWWQIAITAVELLHMDGHRPAISAS